MNTDGDGIGKTLEGLIEQLAAKEHERWTHWQEYLHEQCSPHGTNGALLIPAELVSRWKKQIATPYSDLTESEKESDRQQVRRYLAIIYDALSNMTE